MYRCCVTKVIEPVKYKVEIGESYWMLNEENLRALRDAIDKVLTNV